MKAYEQTARIVGALFLFSNVTFILGAVVFIEPILTLVSGKPSVAGGR